MRDPNGSAALGDVVALDCDRTLVEATAEYPIAGVLNAGQGVFARETIMGAGTNYPTLHRLHEGQLVMRKLTAFEGAITCVPAEFDGWFVSTEFPTFTLDSTKLDPGFMRLVCQWPPLWEQMWLRSTGTVQRRKRVNPSQLLQVRIPLPSIDQQRRSIDLFGAVDADMRSLASLVARTRAALAACRRNLIDLSEWRRVPLTELVTIDAKLVDPTHVDYSLLPHVGVDRIESATGRVLPLSSAADDGVRSGKYLFGPDDIVYAKIRPNLRKVARPRIRGLASADAYPLRPRPGVDADYLQQLLLGDRFSEEAIARSGRTKMPKINRHELLSILVPCPAEQEQRNIGSLLTSIAFVGDRAQWQLHSMRVLRDAILHDVLSGEREIPASYDRLLEQVS